MLTVVLLTRVEGRRWEYCASVAASTRNVSARPLQLAAAGGEDAATSGRKSSEVGAASSQPTSPSTSSSVRCSSDSGDNTNLGKYFYIGDKYFSAQTCSGTLAGGRVVLRRGRGRRRRGTGGRGATSCCPRAWRGRCPGSRPRPGTRGGCFGAPAVVTVTQLPCHESFKRIFAKILQSRRIFVLASQFHVYLLCLRNPGECSSTPSLRL